MSHLVEEESSGWKHLGFTDPLVGSQRNYSVFDFSRAAPRCFHISSLHICEFCFKQLQAKRKRKLRELGKHWRCRGSYTTLRNFKKHEQFVCTLQCSHCVFKGTRRIGKTMKTYCIVLVAIGTCNITDWERTTPAVPLSGSNALHLITIKFAQLLGRPTADRMGLCG